MHTCRGCVFDSCIWGTVFSKLHVGRSSHVAIAHRPVYRCWAWTAKLWRQLLETLHAVCSRKYRQYTPSVWTSIYPWELLVPFTLGKFMPAHKLSHPVGAEEGPVVNKPDWDTKAPVSVRCSDMIFAFLGGILTTACSYLAITGNTWLCLLCCLPSFSDLLF